MKYKVDVEELVYDEDSKPVLDEMGKQKKKIVNREFQSFRPAYVFDVQQTKVAVGHCDAIKIQLLILYSGNFAIVEI